MQREFQSIVYLSIGDDLVNRYLRKIEKAEHARNDEKEIRVSTLCYDINGPSPGP